MTSQRLSVVAQLGNGSPPFLRGERLLQASGGVLGPEARTCSAQVKVAGLS